MPDLDRSALAILIEESEDAHRDAMAATAVALDDLVDSTDPTPARVDQGQAADVAARRRSLGVVTR